MSKILTDRVIGPTFAFGGTCCAVSSAYLAVVVDPIWLTSLMSSIAVLSCGVILIRGAPRGDE